MVGDDQITPAPLNALRHLKLPANVRVQPVRQVDQTGPQPADAGESVSKQGVEAFVRQQELDRSPGKKQPSAKERNQKIQGKYECAFESRE